MYFEIEGIKQYHLDRQQELTKSMQNARYEHAKLAATIGDLLKQAGLWLSLAGDRLQPDQRQPGLELVPVVQNQIRR